MCEALGAGKDRGRKAKEARGGEKMQLLPRRILPLSAKAAGGTKTLARRQVGD